MPMMNSEIACPLRRMRPNGRAHPSSGGAWLQAEKHALDHGGAQGKTATLDVEHYNEMQSLGALTACRSDPGLRQQS